MRILSTVFPNAFLVCLLAAPSACVQSLPSADVDAAVKDDVVDDASVHGGGQADDDAAGDGEDPRDEGGPATGDDGHDDVENEEDDGSTGEDDGEEHSGEEDSGEDDSGEEDSGEEDSGDGDAGSVDPAEPDDPVDAVDPVEPGGTDEPCGSGGCVPAGCAAVVHVPAARPVRIVLVLDRSQSMNQEVDGVAKWQIAKRAVRRVVNANDDRLDFGLYLFPGDNASCSRGDTCEPGRRFVDVGTGDPFAAIDDVLARAETCRFLTPIAATLHEVAADPALDNDAWVTSVVLVTDGKERCDGDAIGAVEALYAQHGVRTFVVGFGSGADPRELGAMADAGRTALPGGERFHRAEDAASLDAALADIAGAVGRCDVSVASAPALRGADPATLRVVVDGVVVGFDPTGHDGFVYDPATGHLGLRGSACDRVAAGNAATIEVFGQCPVVPL